VILFGKPGLMKLISRQDIEAPIAFVFAALKDFDAWERAALRRGADVVRMDKLSEALPGLSWRIRFVYRGKERKLALQLTDLQQPTSMEFVGNGTSIDGMARIDLMELAARRTRLSVAMDLRPRTIGARLIMQSLRLAKTRLNRRFSDRVGQLCAEIETRYRQSNRA
jgi:carbon monoxide dehydrogenase subunit G